jgi:putative transposase
LAATIWLMGRSGVISDEFWGVVEPLLPSDVGRRGRRFVDHRRILEGIVWLFRTGAPWRDLPADFGSWPTVWKRHHRFSFDGTYQRMLDAVRTRWHDGELDDDLRRLLSVDSTVVRGHQHAAGAPRGGDTGG